MKKLMVFGIVLMALSTSAFACGNTVDGAKFEGDPKADTPTEVETTTNNDGTTVQK